MHAIAPPRLDPRQPPPPDYYAGNLRLLVDEVRRRYHDILTLSERRQLDAFSALDVQPQRLLARLLSRRGPYLRADSLDYAEVSDTRASLAALARAGLIEWCPAAPADALLALMTRAEQRRLFGAVNGARKAQWIQCCVGRYPDARIRARLASHHPWLTVTAEATFGVCQTLFFGGQGGDLSTFVIQDLGIRRYENYPLDDATRPFRGRRELDRYLACRRLARWSHELDGVPAMAGVVASLLGDTPLSRSEQRTRNRVLNRIGYWHERRGELTPALACYRLSEAHPARERQARILHGQGDADGVQALLQAMRRAPWAPEEEDFAERFPARRPPLRAPVTECTLPGQVPAHIERYAAALLTSNGGAAWHLENALPLGLAGLCFWDIVFAPVEGAFSNPFQLGPHDLFWPDFVERRRPAVERRIAELEQPGTLTARLRSTLAEKSGIANRLVHWGQWRPELLDALLHGIDPARLLRLAVYTLTNLSRARTGFPDLTVIYGPGAFELVEVKGPGDQLQGAQRIWLRVLDELELPVRVLRFRRGG